MRRVSEGCERELVEVDVQEHHEDEGALLGPSGEEEAQSRGCITPGTHACMRSACRQSQGERREKDSRVGVVRLAVIGASVVSAEVASARLFGGVRVVGHECVQRLRQGEREKGVPVPRCNCEYL